MRKALFDVLGPNGLKVLADQGTDGVDVNDIIIVKTGSDPNNPDDVDYLDHLTPPTIANGIWSSFTTSQFVPENKDL